MKKNWPTNILDEERSHQQDKLHSTTQEMYHRGLPQGAVILSRTQHAFFAEEFDTLENLLEEGWDINSPIIPEDEDYTPLHYAALNEMFDIIQFLVKHDADVNAKTDDGETALDIAKREGYSDIVLFLEKYTNKI